MAERLRQEGLSKATVRFSGGAGGMCPSSFWSVPRPPYMYKLENVEHCGGEPEQAANGFDVGFVTSK